MNKMCIIIPVFLLALVMGTAGAYPLQASDGNATVVLFGSIRMPLELSDGQVNETHEILKVDTGLVNGSNVTYQIVEQYGAVYDPVMYKPLNEGRQLVYFVVPKDSLFKMITATPVGGKPININWWATPKAGNQDLLIRYYGITDWLINPDEQGIVVQVRGQNNGSRDVVFSPEYFTLIDQWGWAYSATAGFDTETIAPEGASKDRVLVGFSGISLQSRPAALVYDINGKSPIAINFENDYLPLTDEQVYGEGGADNASISQPAGQAVQALPGIAAATNVSDQNAVAAAPANNTTAQNATVASKVNSSVSDSKARLAAMRERLKQQTKNDTSAANDSARSTPPGVTPGTEDIM